jgi:transcription antitermination factor NusG
VPEQVIQNIIQNVDRINANPDVHLDQLKRGDPVTILSGPFEGYQAIFDTRLAGSERVRLLIKMLRGQQIRVQVPSKVVKPKN